MSEYMTTKHVEHKPVVVFVHGFMSTPACWHHWQKFFEMAGFATFAPAWPYHDGDIDSLQQHPHADLAMCDFLTVVNHYKAFITDLTEQTGRLPIQIGHSLGGVIIQKLLQDEQASAAICIHSAAPNGMLIWDKDFLWSNWQLLDLFGKSKLCQMPASWYHRYVCNELTLAQSEQFIKNYVAPASKKVALTVGKQSQIDFKKAHAPLLFIAGSQDKSQPAKLNYKNYLAYKKGNSGNITEFKEFAGRTHNVLLQENWQEVADFIVNWLKNFFK